MIQSRLKIGDILKLKSKYSGSAKFGIVIEIHRCENFGNDGWISFDYVILNEKEQIVHISEGCVEEILYSRLIDPHSPAQECAEAGNFSQIGRAHV